MTVVRALLIACVCLIPLGCAGSDKKKDEGGATAAAKRPAGCACPGEGTTCACGTCKDGAGCTCKK